MRQKISFEVEVPESVGYDDLLAWLRFELGEIGEIKSTNPLADKELEAEYETVKIEAPNAHVQRARRQHDDHTS